MTSFYSVLGVQPTFKQEGELITIGRIRTYTMMKDIKRIWNTSRINSYMFVKVGNNSFTIPAFFALELHYILMSLINDRRTRTDTWTLKQICDVLSENSWLKNISRPVTKRLDLSRLDNINYTLKDFQMEFLETYDDTTQRYDLNGMLLAGSAGSGKTATGLALAECLQSEVIVVVCPKNALYRVWKDQVEKVFKAPQSLWIYADGKPYKNERVVVFHYEAIEAAVSMVSQLKKRNSVVILDESHNLTELAALRTQRFMTFCQKIESRDIVLASGTPVKALALETLPLFYAIDRRFTDDVVERFKKMYRGEANRATEILTHRLNIVSYKVLKSQLGLKEPLFYDVKVTVPNGKDFTLDAIAKDMADFAKQQMVNYTSSAKEDAAFFYECLELAERTLLSPELPNKMRLAARAENLEYHQSLDAVIRAYKRGNLRVVNAEMLFCNRYEKQQIIPNLPRSYVDRFKEVKTLVKYMRLKIQGECLGRVLGQKRIQAHVAMTAYLDFESIVRSTLKKTVIFTSFVEVVEKALEVLKAKNLQPLAVYGKVNNLLTDTLTRFENEEGLNPLVATFASLSTAVPLVMADTMLMINTPYRNYILEQTVSRIHRLGADTQTCVYIAQLDTGEQPNISSRGVDILKWSQEQVAKILEIETAFKIDDNEEVRLEDLDGAPAMQFAALEELSLPRVAAGDFKVSIEAVAFETLIATPEESPLWAKW